MNDDPTHIVVDIQKLALAEVYGILERRLSLLDNPRSQMTVLSTISMALASSAYATCLAHMTTADDAAIQQFKKEFLDYYDKDLRELMTKVEDQKKADPEGFNAGGDLFV